MIPFFAVVALLSPAPEEDLREWYDVLAYDIVLDVDPITETLSGSVTITVRVVGDDLGLLALDMDPVLEVVGVERNGEALEYRHDGAELVCELPDRPLRGEEAVVTVSYTGQPRAQGSFSGFHWANTPHPLVLARGPTPRV